MHTHTYIDSPAQERPAILQTSSTLLVALLNVQPWYSYSLISEMCLLVGVIEWRLFENLFQTMRDLQIIRCRYCLQCFFFVTAQFFMLCSPSLQSYSVVPMFVWMGPGPQSALKIVVWTFAKVTCMQKYVSIQSVFVASPHRKVLKKKNSFQEDVQGINERGQKYHWSVFYILHLDEVILFSVTLVSTIVPVWRQFSDFRQSHSQTVLRYLKPIPTLAFQHVIFCCPKWLT